MDSTATLKPVMIDFIHIVLPYPEQHPRPGKPVTVTHPSGKVTSSHTERVLAFGKRGPRMTVQVKGEEMHVYGSPLLWLQGHNGMGSNDLLALVKETVPLVFRALGTAMPGVVREALSTGCIPLKKADIAELHQVPREHVPSLIEALRISAPASAKATPLPEGVGVHLWPKSRSKSVMIYSKHAYYWDRSLDHARGFLGGQQGWAAAGSMVSYRRMVDEYLTDGIRIELRLRRALQTHALGSCHHWSPTAAREVYLAALGLMPFTELPGEPEIDAAIARLKDRAAAAGLVALWRNGHRLQDFGPETSVRREIDIVRQRTGLNLRVAPIASSMASWAELVNVESIVPTPQWAIESGFVYWPGPGRPSRLERVFLQGGTAPVDKI